MRAGSITHQIRGVLLTDKEHGGWLIRCQSSAKCFNQVPHEGASTAAVLLLLLKFFSFVYVMSWRTKHDDVISVLLM